MKKKTNAFLIMSVFTCCTKFLRRYLLCPESLIFLFLVVVIYNTIVNIAPLWQKAVDKFRIRTPQFRTQSGVTVGPVWNREEDPYKSSWEKISGPAAVYAIQGRRPHMEDRFDVFSDHQNYSLYGIFDGHGGEFCAEFVQKSLFQRVISDLEPLQSDDTSSHIDGYKEVLHKQLLNIDNELIQASKEKSDISGTTALVTMVTRTDVIVANVGDSRGVMCDKNGKAIPLSEDHKPNQVREHKRIKDAGGFIGFNGVWRVAGILATSRALGDYPLKDKNLIIADPDILTFNLNKYQPQFLILASDGLWDCFSNEEAVEYIKERLDEPHFGAKSIILQAYYKGSLDNITVMVVKFNKNYDTKEKEE